jgi:hypothetical protein
MCPKRALDTIKIPHFRTLDGTKMGVRLVAAVFQVSSLGDCVREVERDNRTLDE